MAYADDDSQTLDKNPAENGWEIAASQRHQTPTNDWADHSGKHNAMRADFAANPSLAVGAATASGVTLTISITPAAGGTSIRRRPAGSASPPAAGHPWS